MIVGATLVSSIILKYDAKPTASLKNLHQEIYGTSYLWVKCGLFIAF